jgi:membrane-bound lytic murein transglycosylase D
MKKNRKKACFFILILALLTWACSSSKTPKKIITEPQPLPVQEKQSPASALQEEVLSVVQEKEEIKEEIAEESLNQEKEPSTEKEEGAVLLEEALNTYQDALAAWERGDQDVALQDLDEAYGLILRAHLPADSPLLQEKNDLRLLIAQRIQQIYASRLATVGDNHKTIPLEENKEVNDEILSFQTKERKQFEEAFQRAGFYRDMILEKLRKEGLPDELSWLPLIESWYKIKALSKARALGLWQFISSTGYRFGLKRDRWVDERMDPIKSTQAAVKYLAELHTFFGDWTTALAAYNCGEIRIQNVIRTQRVDYLDNFWDLYRQLPYETARFVPRFIAAVLIINNPEKYGFNLPQPYPPFQFETITVNQPFKISSLAASLGVDPSELAFLNPELRHDSTPAYEYALRVPFGNAEKAQLAVTGLPRWVPPEAAYSWHYVRKGETLSTIAARYRASVSAIARLNGLRTVNLLRPGQRLKIPGRGDPVASSAPIHKKPAPQAGEKIVYTVREGDNLARIASTFSTTVEKIKKDNNLESDNLSVGQRLVIESGVPDGAILYRTSAGDTLYSIAKKFAMNLDDFLLLNGLASDAKIYPGQELWVIPKN